MNILEEDTGLIAKGDEDYPVWVGFTEMNAQNYRNTQAPERTLPYLVVLIVNNGKLRVAWDRQGIDVTAGQGVIINRNVPHRLLLAQTESLSFYSLTFSEYFVLPKGKLYDKYAGFYIGNPDYAVLPVSDGEFHGEAFLEDINRVIAMNLTRKNGYELLTRSILCNAWMQLYDRYLGNKEENGENKGASQDERRVKTATAFIGEHFGEPLSLKDIADHIHLSEGECCRLFSRTLFMTPIGYLMEYRIFSAVKILLKTPAQAESVLDLSFIAGFNSPSYFNRIFKKYTQCTPTEYRKLIQRDPERAEKIYTSLQEEITIL